MSHARIQDNNCTLCNQTFRVLWGEMMHPADRLCDGCISTLWRDVESRPLDQLEVELAGRLEHLIGWSPISVAGEVIRRAQRLRNMVSDQGELDAMLAHRRGVAGG